MYLFFEEGHLHPACMSNKSPGMRLQAVPSGDGCSTGPHTMRAVLRNVSNKRLNVLLEFLSKGRASASVEVFSGFERNNTTNKRTRWTRLQQNLKKKKLFSNGNWARRFPRPGKIGGVTLPILVSFPFSNINRHVVSINDDILKAKAVNFINTKNS